MRNSRIQLRFLFYDLSNSRKVCGNEKKVVNVQLGLEFKLFN